MSDQSYEKCIKNWGQDYYSFVYDRKRNRTICHHPEKRELDISIQNIQRYNNRIAEVNAFATYKPNVDQIIVTEALVDLMSDVSCTPKFTQDRNDWIFNVELFLCTFHELGHLLLGHCQLNKGVPLAAFANQTNILASNVKLYQTLEMDADMFAARRLAEKVASMKIFNDMKEFGYTDFDLFYYDTLCGIRAFCYVLCLEEVKEARRQHNISLLTGEKERGCQPGEATHLHPPSLARGYFTGDIFMEHLQKFFSIPKKEKVYDEIFFSGEKLFGGYELSKEQFDTMYGSILDGTFKKTTHNMKKYYLSTVRKMLKPYSRISMGLFI